MFYIRKSKEPINLIINNFVICDGDYIGIKELAELGLYGFKEIK